MFKNLSGKRVLVTGASGGIGQEISVAFASRGFTVGIHYASNFASAESVARKIKELGGKAQLLEADLLIPSKREKLIDAFVSKSGGIDVLVNNAGSVIDYADFRELSLETWEKAFTLNTQVPFELGRHAWPHMASQGGGRIINISSISVKYAGSANSMHYAASKAAMESISNSFAKEGAIDNILSNTIRCGVIDTAMRKNVPNYTEKKFTERLKLIPLGKTGSPADVAALVLFLASDSASFITGDTITMAGGE